MSIIEEIAANAIRSGANAVEVEYKDELYGIAKKSKRITVDGREYGLRCRQGKRLLSHERGNPDTEADRSLNGGNASTDAGGGRASSTERRTADDPRGVRSAHSTR